VKWVDRTNPVDTIEAEAAMGDEPGPPPGYRQYLDELAAAESPAAYPAVSGAAPELAAALGTGVTDRAEDLCTLSHDIHARPELAFAEHFAVETVAKLLATHDADVTTHVWGLPTAFVARAGTGRPHVAILAEYDALPQIGHGCGHNIICSAAVGAFLALAPVIGDLGGRVSLIGTPAEEGGGGKEVIARAGGFDDVDAAIMIHPAGAEAAECAYLGLRELNVTYRGLAAHAASQPYLGRNALDAVVTAYQSIAQLRQHLLPVERVHGVITDGGSKPNIVPERAAASFYFRSPTVGTLEQLTDRADAIFRAAAAATGTEVDLEWNATPVYLPVRTNRPLAARYVAAMAERGRDVPLVAPVPAGSTDMGNVSVRVPAIHPKIAVSPSTISLHSRQFTDYAVSAAGDRAVLDGAIGLARTAADFLADAELRQVVAEDFARAGGVVDVVALDR
jgi:amidohydrolase